MTELLAPAGSWDALRAAVQAGAGAVYLGVGEFHARSRGGGFSQEEFREALAYCHLRGARVYLTLNTLLTDRELPAALEQARTACRWGVDAVLIQDWGLFDLLRRVLPDLPLHASTQMSVFTSGGARLLYEDGCERVVAARECSREDLQALCRGGGAEIEAFVHGALCMCYSGQCAMSCLLGGRSGNRGQCAQPCRLAYGAGRRALSLKDLSLAEHIPELSDMGLACLKIEGRMRRPEYVAAVTAVYARLLAEGRRPTEEEARELEAAFSRSGFTDGYWTGATGPAMFGARPEGARETDAFLSRARTLYERDDRRTVMVDVSCAIRRGERAVLSASDSDGHMCAVEGPVPEEARKRPLTEGEVADRLRKTGGTVYRCRRVEAAVEEGLSLPASAVNDLRRRALEGLTAQRIAPPARREEELPPLPESAPVEGAPRLTVSALRWEQFSPGVFAMAPARLYVPLELLSHCRALPETAGEWCVILPRIWRDRDEGEILRALDRARSLGVNAALAGNIGHIALLRGRGWRIYGDAGLNVTNARSLAYLREKGLSSACLSFELRCAQMRDMAKPLPSEAIVYGRLPLMVTENRPLPTGGPEDVLTDRRGETFPLLDLWGGRTEIENSRPLWLADRTDWRTAGLAFARLRFTVEPPALCERIFLSYAGEGDPTPPASFTRGTGWTAAPRPAERERGKRGGRRTP